jgi:tetratricopeptide (TPR) repeat protein
VTERKNVLSLFFFLLALLAWLRFIDEPAKRKLLAYAFALVCYALALFAKTTACTLPAALLLILWLKERPINWRRAAEVVPFVAVGIGMGLVTIWWERYHQGTQGKPFALGPVERLLVASRAVWFYLGKLVWPANLIFSYPHWDINRSNPLAYGWLAAGAVAAGIILFVRRWTGRGLEVAAMFFATTLMPVLGFVMLYTFIWSFVADHYQYVACIGPIALAAAAITWAFARKAPALKYVVCVALLLTLGTLTWKQCGIYADVDTLWRATIERNPNSWLANYNLGTILAEKQRVDEAIPYLQKTVEIRPEFAGGHYNLGSLYLYKGELDAAIGEFQTTLGYDPHHALAWYKLGTALSRKGRTEEAIPDYEKAVEIYPACVDAHRSLAAARFQQGRMDDAILHFQEAIKLQPNNPSDYVYVGNALLRKGDIDGAIAYFQKALDIKPDSLAHNNLGNALMQKEQMREAAEQFQKALELEPHNMLAENNLAFVMATATDSSLRNGPKAVELAEDADRLSGGQNPFVILTLGAAYAETGRFPEAITAAKRGEELAASQNNPGLAVTFQQQIALYQAGKPFRPTPAPVKDPAAK